jgi:hypothetical protein
VSAAADGGAKKASPGSVDGIDAVSAGVADGAKKPAKPPAPAPVGKLAPASTRATAVDGIDAVTSGVADGAKKPAGKPDPSAPDAVSTGHE